MLLKKFSGFNKFIRLNHIDEATLLKAVEYLEIREIKEGEYFLHEGEPSKFFAGLIKGRISFRKAKIINKETNEIVLKHLYKVSLLRKPTIKKQVMKSLSVINSKDNNEKNKDNSITFKIIMNNMNTNSRSIKNKIKSYHRFSMVPNYSTIKSRISLINNKYTNRQEYRIIKEHFDPKKYVVKEEEIFQAGTGYCFGEWALIYNQPRSASVVTLEDCIFFILDEKIFTKTFLKCLNNSEYKKKKFVMEHLFPFNLFNERQSSIYKNIIPITCERNQIVFNEGDKSDKIYVIYLGTFILKRKYKHKDFNVLSLEKGSVVGLESIFEGENSKFRCTLKLNSYDELGLIFSCSVNKLVPYIIKKMKEIFKNNYLLYLKTSEEFYLNNINIQRKNFFKRKGEIFEDQKDNLNNNINDKRYLSLKNLNKTDNKTSVLENIKKIKSIKFRNYNQMKINYFPFLSIIKQNTLKNKDFERILSRTKTTIKGISLKRLKLNLKESNDKILKNHRTKRMKTYLNYHYESNKKVNLLTDNSSRSNNKNENNSIEGKKYIENYKDKQIYNKIPKIKLKEIINVNNNNSFSEKKNKKSFPTTIFQKSNNNEFNNGNLYRESSFKKIFQKTANYSKISEINDIKDDYFRFKERLIKHKKRLEFKLLFTNDKNNQINSRILFTKREEEKTKLNLSTTKINKNKASINKYINYLLSYEKKTIMPKNLENI